MTATPPGPVIEYGPGHLAVAIHDDGGCAYRSGPLTPEQAGQLTRDLLTARREAFGIPPPSASVVEIIEPGHTTTDGPGSVIMPRDVLINGVSVYTTGGVRIHEMDLAVPKELATVTLTLPARRITVAAEGDL